MNTLLSIALSLSLIMLSCCGHVAGLLDYSAVTQMSENEYDYSYTANYSYYPEAEPYIPDKASGIDQMNLLLLLGLAVLQIWN